MCIVCVGIMHVRTRRVNFGMAMWFGLLVSSDALEGGKTKVFKNKLSFLGTKLRNVAEEVRPSRRRLQSAPTRLRWHKFILDSVLTVGPFS